jgi:hypothetical protein
VDSLTEVVLRSIYAHESGRADGATVDELAAELGIPPMFGHQRLSERLYRQMVMGRVYSDGGHFHLTAAGRRLAVSGPAE